jgi:hypothetical protein
MDEGILSIKLVPAWSPPTIAPGLVAALARSSLLQAGIGYWTINDALLGPHLPRWTPENRPLIDSPKPATTSAVTETSY